MSNPASRVAYAQYYAVFDRAIESPLGVRLAFPNRGQAFHYRSRLHSARDIDRRHNKALYEVGHALHGASAYDTLIVRDPKPDAEGNWWLYVERNDEIKPHIEDIPAVEDLPLVIEHRPTLRIEVVRPAPLIRRPLEPTE